ncbi:MAG: patatin-like phospholipase family protein [Pseudomonadota bacterium]|nr:patatin-like phospholipase family protein [Pseudomonadota bacterium]
MKHKVRRPSRIGLALGGGASRGWAHIGVINALSELDIHPEIVCGCSIGAIVGASYVSGNLESLENWVGSLTKVGLARFFELNLSLNGFVDTEKLQEFLLQYVCREQQTIEDVTTKFASVATDLETGREIWFTRGLLIEAVWASISLPGLFPPFQDQGRWLVDGGLVNPVPVSVCRALGADIVISVNLNGDIVGKHFIQKHNEQESASPGLFDAIAGSLNIAQDRITRSRLAGDPPDIMLTPKLSHIGLLEFYRAKEAMLEGRECVTRLLPEIRHVLGK